MSPYCAAPGCHDSRTYLYGRLEDGRTVTHEHHAPDAGELARLEGASVEPLQRLCRVHAKDEFGMAQRDTLPASHKCPLPEVADGHWICAGCGREWWADGDQWRLDPPF